MGNRIAKLRMNPLLRWIAERSRWYLWHFENHNFDHNLNGERGVLEKLRDAEMRVVFDIGANVGDWATLASRCFSRSTIHCFEIMPSTFDVLTENMGTVANVAVNGFGLSDRAGEVELKYYPGYSTVTSIFDYPQGLASTRVTGRVTTGDEYVESHGIERIDFMKLDVEGSEHLVLKGFSRMLDSGKIEMIQFEYGTINILTKFLLHDFYKLLTAKGYVIGKIYPRYVEFRDYQFGHEDFLGPNYLAVRESRKDLIKLLGSLG
jgi:FkbM family methyltransferase